MEHVTEGSWESLPVPLHPGVLGSLRELGFPYMTPVQVGAGAAGTVRLQAGRGRGELELARRHPEFSPLAGPSGLRDLAASGSQVTLRWARSPRPSCHRMV